MTFINNVEGWRTKTKGSTFSFDQAYHPTGHLVFTQSFNGAASYRLDPLGCRIERGAV
jgi:hypothetical protein